MDDAEFDRSLVAAAFGLAGERGWDAVSVAEAARRGGLSLAQARERFPSRAVILIKFGRLADQSALGDPPKEGSVRDRLFYLLMQRIDALQANRPGLLALLRTLPSRPKTAVLLGCATRRSMRWMLEAAGVSARGIRGELRTRASLPCGCGPSVRGKATRRPTCPRRWPRWMLRSAVRNRLGVG